MIAYHWSPNKFNQFRSNYQGIHLASNLQTSVDLAKNRNKDFNTGYVYEVEVSDNLRYADFDIDTMDWSAWDILNLLLGKLGETKIEGATEGVDDEGLNWSENVDPSVVKIPYQKLKYYKNFLLDRFDLFWAIKTGKDEQQKVEAFKTMSNLLRKLGYDAISYSNYGENSLGDKCYILFSPNQVRSFKFLGTGKQIKTQFNLKESLLLEDTRLQFASKSRNAGEYKNKQYGKNRFERRTKSKIATSVSDYNKIDMNLLFKQDTLEVVIPVIGETDNYSVTVKFDGIVDEMAKNIKNNKYRFEFRTVLQALTKRFNIANIYVDCTCKDFLINFKHNSVIHNYGVTDTAHDPGPGKNIANPDDEKGRGCKHVQLIINNGDWLMRVASVINNYIHYMSEKMHKQFLKLIFPKLYGCEADEMARLDILGKDEVEETLDSNASFIDAINEYGKNRGKIKKGSNKNSALIMQGEPEENAYDNDNQKNLKKAEKETAEANKKAQAEAEAHEKEIEAERQAKIKAAEDNSEKEEEEN